MASVIPRVPTGMTPAAAAGVDGHEIGRAVPVGRARPTRRPRWRGPGHPWPNDQRSIIAADRIVPIGFAMSRPAMSGAEPWIGS